MNISAKKIIEDFIEQFPGSADGYMSRAQHIIAINDSVNFGKALTDIQTALKKGPMLRFMDVSVICSPRYQRYVLDLAEEKGIPVQASVREGGGNNGAMINSSLDGIPVVVIGVPVRYIHSHYGIASYYDFEATVKLAVEVVRSMTKDIIESF